MKLDFVELQKRKTRWRIAVMVTGISTLSVHLKTKPKNGYFGEKD